MSFQQITAQVMLGVHKFPKFYKTPKNPRCQITWSRFHAEEPQILDTATQATWFVYPSVISQFWVFFTLNKWQVSLHYHHHHQQQQWQQHMTLFNSLPQSSSCGWSLQVAFKHPGFIHPRGLYSKANFDVLFFIQYKCCVKFCVVINFTDNIWNIFLLMSAFCMPECSRLNHII